MIRIAVASDLAANRHIYNYHLSNTIITVEEDPISAEVIASRLAEAVSAVLPCCVIETKIAVVSDAYAANWKARGAYRHSSKVRSTSIMSAKGEGLVPGSLVISIEDLRRKSLQAVLGGIALTNEASISLQKNLGFREVWRLAQVGRKFDRWIDLCD